jgi:hypothetical protein
MRVCGVSIYLGFAGILLLWTSGHEIIMHAFNVDGTAGLYDISKGEITKDMVDSGVIGHKAIVHLCTRDGLSALMFCTMIMITMAMGTSYQKFYTLAMLVIMEGCQVGLPFWVPLNGEKPPYFGDNKFITLIRVLLHPCTALIVAACYDDDILEQGPDYEKPETDKTK